VSTASTDRQAYETGKQRTPLARSALASRRRFATGTAIGTISRAGLTSPRSSAKLPAWPIGRPRIYGLPGASYIAPDRLSGSVAIW
jgi:hypothetical protein